MNKSSAQVGTVEVSKGKMSKRQNAPQGNFRVKAVLHHQYSALFEDIFFGMSLAIFLTCLAEFRVHSQPPALCLLIKDVPASPLPVF
jgi:hypothetical protein